jgi:hypothetical protein
LQYEIQAVAYFRRKVVHFVACYGQAVPSELRPITDLTALHRLSHVSTSARYHVRLLLLLLQITRFSATSCHRDCQLSFHLSVSHFTPTKTVHYKILGAPFATFPRFIEKMVKVQLSSA